VPAIPGFLFGSRRQDSEIHPVLTVVRPRHGEDYNQDPPIGEVESFHPSGTIDADSTLYLYI
jgi:hypothetical protein